MLVCFRAPWWEVDWLFPMFGGFVRGMTDGAGREGTASSSRKKEKKGKKGDNGQLAVRKAQQSNKASQ